MTALLTPCPALLPAYVAALERGWSPDALHPTATEEELAAIRADPDGFLASLDDTHGRGPPIRLPDGTLTPRLPGYWRWIWDTDFCGAIGLRWQPGSDTLPGHILGHVGYGIVAWRQGEGLASRALRLLLPHAWSLGLAHVEVVTEPDNTGSRRVAEACGGVLTDRFRTDAVYGGAEKLRYRIARPGEEDSKAGLCPDPQRAGRPFDPGT